MCGIDNNFINKYHQFTTPNSDGGKNLSNNELSQLEKMVSSGKIDPAAAEKLKEELTKGGIDSSGRELLLAIGHSTTDTTKLNKFKQALDSDPVNGQISDLIDRGFQERKSEESRDKNDYPIETFFRNVADKSGISSYSKVVSEFYHVDVSINTPKEEAQIDTRKLVSENSPVFNNSVEDDDCIKDSLKSIAARNKGLLKLGDVPTRAVSQSYLQDVTGKEWDGINIKQSNDLGHLNNALKGQEGKALVVVGAHTFVFEGFDKKTGDLNVTDPSDGNKPRTIAKNNPAASAYALKELGGGDGPETQGINKGGDTSNIRAMIKPYKNITPDMNSSDKNNEGSLNNRKLLSLMGDPTQKATFYKIKGYIENSDIMGLKKTLGEKGIKLGPEELENMIVKMRAPLSYGGQSTTLLSQMEKLQNDNVNDKSRYQFGIQYSDVNLNEYFTRTSPDAMNKVFQDMIAGRDGC